jgi:heat shock protein HslJ
MNIAMQKNKMHILFQLSVLMVIWSSCTSTLYVAPKQVDCTGVSDQKCFLIRSMPGENWILHYHDISGLEYEPGFSYKIKVKKERIKNPPMDASSFNLTLIEILEKTDVTDDLELKDLANKEWKLEFLRQKKVEVGIEKQVPTLEFDMNGKVKGFGGCNNFFGSFTLDGRIIKIGEIGSTRKHCEGEMELENSYFEVLGIEARALFSEGKLVLTGDAGNQMIFGYK